MPITDDDRWAALSDDEKAAALALLKNPQPDPEPEPEQPAAADDGWNELQDFYDDTLKLRWRGHEYVLHAPDVELGLLCQQFVHIGFGALVGDSVLKRAVRTEDDMVKLLDDDTEEALYLRLLGGDQSHPSYRPDRDVWAQLKRDGASWPLFKHMGVTALVWAGHNREAAVSFWLGGAHPKDAPQETAPAPKAPQDRKTADTATTTPRQDSGSSTTTRKQASKATRGRKSGATGG